MHCEIEILTSQGRSHPVPGEHRESLLHEQGVLGRLGAPSPWARPSCLLGAWISLRGVSAQRAGRQIYLYFYLYLYLYLYLPPHGRGGHIIKISDSAIVPFSEAERSRSSPPKA